MSKEQDELMRKIVSALQGGGWNEDSEVKPLEGIVLALVGGHPLSSESVVSVISREVDQLERLNDNLEVIVKHLLGSANG